MTQNFENSNGGWVHVDAYTRDDGTHVNAYWRRRPGIGGYFGRGFFDDGFADDGFAPTNPLDEILPPNHLFNSYNSLLSYQNQSNRYDFDEKMKYYNLISSSWIDGMNYNPNNIFTNQYLRNNAIKKIATHGLDILNQTPAPLKNKLEDALIFGVKKSPKNFTDFIGEQFSKRMDSPEAFELYKVGSPNFNYNQDYVRKNGKLYNSTKELGNEILAQKIQAWLFREQTGMTDCKVLKLEPNSSLSQKIANSEEIKDILKNTIEMLRYAKVLPTKKIKFETDDLYNSMHGCDLTYAKLDKEGNLIMRFEDLWNFNEGRTSVRNRVGEALQNRGELIPYYLIVDVKIPKSELDKY